MAAKGPRRRVPAPAHIAGDHAFASGHRHFARSLSFLSLLGLLSLTSLSLPAQGDREPITSLRELRSLSRGEAAKSLPVEVRGTITYYEPNYSLAFIQTEDGAAYFSPENARVIGDERSIDGEDRIRPGDYVHIKGHSIAGGFG